MLQSLLVIYFANVMIIPITFATPFQQFSTNLQTGDIQADLAPSFLEASYDGDQTAVDSSTSKPAFLANNQLDWLKTFFVPSPPPWQGTDKNIAAKFTCEASTAYCCTGRYDVERKYALQPCFYYNPEMYECQTQLYLYCCTGTSDLVGGATGCSRIGYVGV